MTALDKAKQKLEANLGAKAYYEAQQQVLTVYRRLRSKGSKLEAHELLTFAINRMFVAAQGQLAVELAQILFENWEIDEQDQAQSASTYSKYILGELGRQDISSEAYNLVATSAIKLIRSWDFDGGKVAELCTVAGETLFASRGAENFYLASKYLARGTDMQTFANVINKASNDLLTSEGEKKQEERLFVIVRSALKVLCLHKSSLKSRIKLASDLYANCMDARPNPSKPKQPIQNFFDLLLLALDQQDFALYQLARREYKPILDQDPGIAADLDKLSSMCFSKSSAGSGLENLFSSLLGSLASPTSA